MKRIIREICVIRGQEYRILISRPVKSPRKTRCRKDFLSIFFS